MKSFGSKKARPSRRACDTSATSRQGWLAAFSLTGGRYQFSPAYRPQRRGSPMDCAVRSGSSDNGSSVVSTVLVRLASRMISFSVLARL